MTTYAAIEALIENRAIRRNLAIKMIFDAYYHDRIDGQERDKLYELAEAKCPID